MSSSSRLSYNQRADSHWHPVAKRLLKIADTKKTNLIISANLSTTTELLECADRFGPYIAVLKTHIDFIRDFSEQTVQGLKSIAQKHNFLIFEDRKFIDIGHTTQKQYHDGALRISEFAHIVNISILSGDDVVAALSEVIRAPDFPYHNDRAIILFAEMTSRGSLATGDYTRRCVEVARSNTESVIGFVAVRSLHTIVPAAEVNKYEDFIIFTTGISQSRKGDGLGQQYQTPTMAIQGGSDFIIAGRGIYASQDPEETAKSYRLEGWEAYLKRLNEIP